MNDKKLKILNFIKNKEFTVVSNTNQKGFSESAVVAFSETDHLEIVFGTYNTARKYGNIKKNPRVSLVIGWDNKEKITVQYEGLARELSEKEEETYRERHITKNPESKNYLRTDGQRYFLIKPLWIRYSDFFKEPNEIFELVF